jgi:hypothetical protein
MLSTIRRTRHSDRPTSRALRGDRLVNTSFEGAHVAQEMRSLSSELSTGPRIRGVAWTPDGRSLIVGKHDDASSDIVVIELRP